MSATQDRLKVGLDLPMNDRTGMGWTELRDIAMAAEDVGFDSIWVDDHLLYHYEGNPEPNGNWESWTMLTAIAASTKTVEMGHLVLGMGFRNPAMLAKIADTFDEVSGGRLILGIGAGYHKREYTAFGYPYDNRFNRFEEALQIVHGLLRNGEIDFEGRFYSARDCILRPRGPRPEGPPIMVGTTGHRMLRLTAKYADMWNSYWTRTNNSPGGVAPLRTLIDEACEEVGRDPATLQRTVSVLTAEAGADPWWESLPTSHDYEPFAPLSGEPEVFAEGLRAYHREGIAQVQISVDQISTAAIERLGPGLELLKKEG
jgi:alkanesulfonate monooxygenase SsuD/methylene tetrahydromethanopterin reductase-like flavin-dependent oxidoreductase (luciferase family)